jgi:ribosomal protein L24
MHKKHIKPQRSQKHPEGGVVELPRSIHVSNVMLMSEGLARPVRTGTLVTDDGKKIRVAKGRGINAEAV